MLDQSNGRLVFQCLHLRASQDHCCNKQLYGMQTECVKDCCLLSRSLSILQAGGRPDIITAADVLYWPDARPALLASLRALSAPHTLTYVAYRTRNAHEEEFVGEAEVGVQFIHGDAALVLAACVGVLAVLR